MLLFHFFLLPQNPDLTVMLAEAFSARLQKMTFSSCEREFTFYSSQVLPRKAHRYDWRVKKKVKTLIGLLSLG